MCQGFLLVCGMLESLGGLLSWVVLCVVAVGLECGLCCVVGSMGWWVVFSNDGSWLVSGVN